MFNRQSLKAVQGLTFDIQALQQTSNQLISSYGRDELVEKYSQELGEILQDIKNSLVLVENEINASGNTKLEK